MINSIFLPTRHFVLLVSSIKKSTKIEVPSPTSRSSVRYRSAQLRPQSVLRSEPRPALASVSPQKSNKTAKLEKLQTLDNKPYLILDMDEISLSTIQALERIPLEQLIETYIKMSVEVIKEMQNRDDPEFLRSLKYAKSQMTREEFLSIQIEVYAACNQFAMQQCTAVDQIAHMVVLHDSVSLMDL